MRTVSQFRRRLPVADYEYFRPYIDEVKAGRTDSLLGAKNRLLMFSLTSGTTAQSKYIPITERFLADYRSGWQIWGIQAIDAHPGINSRHILQLSSDYDLFRTPGGTPCGNISGLVAACQKRIVRTMYTVPGVVSKIRDSDAKLYTAMRLAIADRHIGMVMTANPSTLIQLAKLADARKEDLIRDIADGTLSSAENVPGEVRHALRRTISRKRQERARELEAIVDRTGSLLPKDFWPEMQLLAIWTGGSAGAYLSTLKRYFGEIPVRDHGLSASEGRMTIPVADHSPDGILDVTSHFFEFLPEEEYGREDALVLEAHELARGAQLLHPADDLVGPLPLQHLRRGSLHRFLSLDADDRVPAQGSPYRQRHRRKNLRVAGGPRGPQRHRRDATHAVALHRQPGLGRSAAIPVARRAGRRRCAGRRFAGPTGR